MKKNNNTKRLVTLFLGISLAASTAAGCSGMKAKETTASDERDTDSTEAEEKSGAESTSAAETEPAKPKKLIDEYPGYVEILREYYLGNKGLMHYDWELQTDVFRLGWDEKAEEYLYYYVLKDVNEDHVPELFVSCRPLADNDYHAEGIWSWENGAPVSYLDAGDGGQNDYKYDLIFKKDLIWVEYGSNVQQWHQAGDSQEEEPFIIYNMNNASGLFTANGEDMPAAEYDQFISSYDQPCDENWTLITSEELERLGAAGPFSINRPSAVLTGDAAKTDDSTSDYGTGSFSPFYGIWYGASKSQEEAQTIAERARNAGFDGQVFLSTDWSNLNQDPWYVITAGTYSSKDAADAALAAVKAVFPDAYVKYSGEYQGTGGTPAWAKADDSTPDSGTGSFSPFYGIWYGASKGQEEAQTIAERARNAGFDGQVFLSTDWSNLNQDPWYVVTAGTYSSKDAADAALAAVKAVFPDAYVKYSGEYQGNGSTMADDGSGSYMGQSSHINYQDFVGTFGGEGIEEITDRPWWVGYLDISSIKDNKIYGIYEQYYTVRYDADFSEGVPISGDTFKINMVFCDNGKFALAEGIDETKEVVHSFPVTCRMTYMDGKPIIIMNEDPPVQDSRIRQFDNWEMVKFYQN